MREPVRVIQTFVRACDDCPNCGYYSGGMYECSLTFERIRPDNRKVQVGDKCPLPFAGPPTPTIREAEEAT